MDAATSRQSPVQSKSKENFSPPKRQPWQHGGLSREEHTPSPKRNLDPALRALDDILMSSFVHAILNQKAPPHFSLPKFQMYNWLQDRPPDALSVDHDSLDGKRCPFVQGIPVKLIGSQPVMVPSPGPNSMTYFRWLSKKFVSQYMCSVRHEHSVTNMFHVRMGRFKIIRDFMKWFGAALL